MFVHACVSVCTSISARGAQIFGICFFLISTLKLFEYDLQLNLDGFLAQTPGIRLRSSCVL